MAREECFLRFIGCMVTSEASNFNYSQKRLRFTIKTFLLKELGVDITSLNLKRFIISSLVGRKD